MRTRRSANTERLRAKEFRLKQVILRQEFARLYSAMPKGIIGSLSHVTSDTTSTINTPLLALVDTASETWKVDFETVPDSTGGFADVTIPAARQIGELASQAVVSFAGQGVGTYVVYAQHTLADENPEQRDPPGKYAGGTGVTPEHRTFFAHGRPDNTPIPREAYDETLTPEVVSEAVDRLTIAFAAENSVPSDATPLIKVVWNGSSVASSEVVARSVNVTSLYDHIGAGGTAHAAATTSVAGFMSAADKMKLDNATESATASRLVMRDSSGRAKVATPSDDGEIANKSYVDTALASAALLAMFPQLNANSRIYFGRSRYNPVTGVYGHTLPPGWSATTGSYTQQGVDWLSLTVTHNLDTHNYFLIATPIGHFVDTLGGPYGGPGFVVSGGDPSLVEEGPVTSPNSFTLHAEKGGYGANNLSAYYVLIVP